MKSKSFTKLFYILIIIATFINISLYIYFNYKNISKFDVNFQILNSKFFINTFYIQLIGLVLTAIYQYYIFNNLPKYVGFFGILIDLIQITIFINQGLFGLVVTYCYGILSELYLWIFGKDKFINDKSLKKYIIQIIVLLILAGCCYYFFSTFEKIKENIWKFVFDFISTILIPVAYYLQSIQSKKQFLFWISSDISGLATQFCVKSFSSLDIYTILEFIYYIIFDTLNAIKWYKYQDEKKQ